MFTPSLSLLSQAATTGPEEVAPTFWQNTEMYLQSVFKKVSQISLPMWIALAALVALAVVLLVIGGRKAKWSATTIAFAALAIALSFLLSNIRLYRMPQGGSITLASMLPLQLFSYAFGVIPGILTGIAYGVLQFLQTPSLLPIAPFFAVCQLILDYVLAFGLIGLAGVFGKKRGNDQRRLSYGIVLACVLRFVCSVASGVLFFAEYAGDQNPLWYSVVYNGSYMLPEMLISVVIGILIGPRLCKVMRQSASIK